MFVRSIKFNPIIRQLKFQSFTRLNNTAVFNEVVANIRNDLKLNFRSKADVMEKNVIRAMLTDIKNLEIKNHNKKDNDEFDLFQVFAQMIKQREKSALEFFALGNPDKFNQLGENELRECEYIKKYMSQLGMASDLDLEPKLQKVIDEIDSNGDEVTLQNVYKKIPMKTVERDWNCSRLQISAILGKLLNLN